MTARHNTDEPAATGPGSQPNASAKGLSREVIVRAALAMIDASGTNSLTMRKLGQRLGVEAMSLYRYVSGREDLLEAVVAHLLDGLESSLDQSVAARSWQGYLQTLATAVRHIATEHPHAFPLVATRHPAAPWLRPPLRSLSLVEDLITNLLDHGFTDNQAVQAYRNFSSFLLGQLLLEATVRGAEVSPVEEPMDEGNAKLPGDDADIDLREVPQLARLRVKLSEDHSTDEFETGLETLLDRMELHLSQ